MSFQILPLAITMMAGPQIMSAIVFVTTEKAIRLSLAFLSAVAIATSLGVAIATGLASLVGNGVSLDDSDRADSAASIIQIVLVGLLLVAAVHSYLGRRTAEQPKWLGALVTADAKKAFETGFLLILLFPSDIVVLLTVGVNLQRADPALGVALAFIAATVLVAGLPLLAYLLFRRRAERAMPKVRDWMSAQSWLVNIIVYAFFIVLILSSG
ncbi:GAP family protein [Candidatus Protofrankia californiensis]|uniref:GAP family protein n=1 Tax=Candidatus Protofrankia californiensis TaxID=1839754 RepID=UPI001040E7D4|nr:GAP family protein [Candidatus Protofrankia californiensis]